MRAAVVVGLAGLAACYDPSYRELACGANGACPSGFTCAADVCVRDVEVDARIDAIEIDGPPDGDLPPIDADDDAEVDAVPPCPVGDLTSPTDPTRCFRFFADPTDWFEARDACAAIGGMLTDVRDPQENVALIDLVGDSPSTWLGGTDAAVQGTWLWPDGAPFSYSAWGEGQPTGQPGEDCVRFVGPAVLGFGPSDWTDVPCAQLLPRICVRAP
jgi:hypothetical protein